MLHDYFAALVFLVFSLVIAIAARAMGYLLGPNEPNKGKVSPYECGFDGLGDARLPFDVRYYLVAILFILFDLETAFLFPWGVSLRYIGWQGFWAMVFFLALLLVGFAYEWRRGALEWE